jgi:hypothetical protein
LVSLAEFATQDAPYRPGRVPVDEGRKAIRLASLCRLAAAQTYYVVSADGEEIGTVVAVEVSGRRSVPERVWMRREATQAIEILPLTCVSAVDAVDHVIVLTLDRKAVDRRRLRLLHRS